MKERSLLAGPGPQVLDHERAGGERRRKGCRRDGMARDRPGARDLGPDRGEMALARAFGADQRDCWRRPVRPAVDQRERARIRGTGEKILAAEAFVEAEREGELARSHVPP